jgi:ABC-2 type transport system ATP-binding protein
MTSVLEISGLKKYFGHVKAIDGLDLRIESGTVHGLVGPNGAGKTTMLSILVGLRRKTSGDITFGIPNHQVMLLPDTPDFFPFLTAREMVNLSRYPFRNQVDERLVEQVIEEVGLADSIDRRVGGFSRGMKQRLGLATTIIAEPKLMILDEPCSALDPLGRREVLDLISRLRDKSTVLFSTHILSDVESVCDTVTVIDHGKSLYDGPIDSLGKSESESFEDAVIRLLQSSSNAS